MAKYDEKLERFTSAILSDATKVCDNIRQEIDAEYTRALSEAENEILAEAFKYIKEEIAKIKAAEGKRLSKKLLEVKRTLFLRRSEIANNIFDELKGRIEAYTKTPEYTDNLISLSRKASGMLPGCGDVTVYMRSADMHRAEQIRSALSGYEVKFEEGGFYLGGIIFECKEKHIRIDESYDLAIAERYEHFTEMFGISLAEL
ncbi:MAG: V-type ATP synthase subunit E [Bacillota bacterium]|nr:V-type ATP synthase subunit E [Bacillota bacterium]